MSNVIRGGQIKVLLKIPKQVGVSRSTLYLELKRDKIIQMSNDLLFRKEYFAYTGQFAIVSMTKLCSRSTKE